MHGHLALAVAKDLPHVVIEAQHVSRDIELRDSDVEEILLMCRLNNYCRCRV
jgi:hypothetical protein